ncbi:Nuclear protein DGCR14 [Penicillium riverlandense]|uniref:Nuclear protein DGCR14 n=1 Tax=Penicillium riverlandense TaxID=1903569 RepID=UPI0025465B20|nr:Nuclear protein DGCR14 [Penicillium riverlandense]KAJ5812528.1 Nuclear protein DGCR14 [Penicillium riverlandense]
MASPTPSSQALAKRSQDNQLMPPPPPPKRIKRPATVLDEDIYTDALSHIIARDFFPGLLETQTKQEYLDALESKDKQWITSAKKKLADVMRTPIPGSRTPARTPQPQHFAGGSETPRGWGGETPMSVASATTAEEREQDNIPDVSNLGLLAFQAKYTSEDNESFNKVLDKQNAKKREKHAWLWNQNKIPSARQIAHHESERKRITAQGGNPESSLIKRDDQQPAIKTDLNSRPARPDGWDARPDNSLMFLPSSVEDTHETIQQKAEAASRAGPKRVLYQNTRLVDQDAAAAADAVPPSPSLSAIQDAIAGKPRLSESEAASAVPGGETPRVNGYAFVDEDEPEPELAETEADWRLLGASTDTTPNPFQLRETRKREALHHRMVDRVARNKRIEKVARSTKTPVSSTPRFASSPRVDFGLRGTPGGSGHNQKMLTPAAQKLLHRVGGSTPRTAGGNSGEKNMWTPTPRRK